MKCSYCPTDTRMKLYAMSVIDDHFSECNNCFKDLSVVRESKKANVTQIVTTAAHISIEMIAVAVCIDPSS